MTDLMVKAFDFCFECQKIIIYHFLKYGPFLHIVRSIVICDFLYVFDRITSVHFFAFEMVLYATFGFADGAGAATANAAAYLDCPQSVKLTQCCLLSLH